MALFFKLIWVAYCVGTSFIWIYAIVVLVDIFGLLIGGLLSVVSTSGVIALSLKACSYYCKIEYYIKTNYKANYDSYILALKLFAFILLTFFYAYTLFYFHKPYHN